MSTPTPHTRNVTRVYRQACEDTRERGRTWYADAHATAQEYAARYGVTVEQAAGVLAALSPLTSWGQNKRRAQAALAGRPYGLNAGKARRIVAGESPLTVLGGDKVRAFYALILSGGRAPAVCIDRHAFDVAIGRAMPDRPALKSAEYARVAACYVQAARILTRELGRTVTASEVQAVTWVEWRRQKFVTVGAYDA